MNNQRNAITSPQLFFLMIQSQIGVGVLSLPYVMFGAAKIDGWISVLIAGAAIQLILFCYYFLFRRFPGCTIAEIAVQVAGKKAGWLINLLYSFYFLSVGALIIVLFNQIIDSWILPFTPNWVIGIMLSFTGAFLATGKIKDLARFYMLITPILVVVIFLVSYTLTDANIFYLLPLGQTGLMKILVGGKEAVIAMLGFESMLFFFAAASGPNRQKLKAMTLANVFITVLYTYFVIVSFIYFSPQEIIIIPEPLLYILKSYTFNIIERTDLLFLAVWVFLVHTSFTSYLFLAGDAVNSVFKKAPRQKLIALLASAMFGLSLFPSNNIEFISMMKKYISNASFIFVFFIPLCVLALSLIRKKKANGGKGNDQTEN